MRVALLIPVLCTTAAMAASAAASKPTVTLTTSLGPIAEDDTRRLRARGTAPRGATLVVTFLRGGRVLGRARPKLRGRRYAAGHPISRTGSYRVRVTARTRSGEIIRVTSRLDYGPEAKAPVQPPPPPD